MVGVSFLRTLSNLQWNGLLCIRHPHLIIPKGMPMLKGQLASLRRFTLNVDNFLLGLLVHRTMLLLYMRSKLSPAELFFGCRLASDLPVIHNSNPELVTERQPSDNDPSRTRSVNFEPNDNVWVHLSPLENVWKQGVIIHSVVGVPDSFVIEINGQQYWWYKHDLTFCPRRGEGDDDVVGAEEQDGTENRTDRLWPRPALKFPKLPMQATLHLDFEL